MSGRLRKGLLLLLSAVLLTGVFFLQKSLNHDREVLGLTRVEPLDNAPPVLAFTTVALGGFRGLISNLLWMRATELQDEDKFFEMKQLADWITKLEPHFAAVWVEQGWNMSYNISVKFSNFDDRWRWVRAGISLLRDEGLRYNPNSVSIHRELAWDFQHKIGEDLDDASRYYKEQWAKEMTNVFGGNSPDFDQLIHPKTAGERARVKLLRDKYKLDPAMMKEVDEKYGPLDWRLPEAHAIYWASLGLKKAEENPSKVKKSDLIQLHRVIYQSMLMSLHRGHLVDNPYENVFELEPNLAVIPKLNTAYLEAMQEDKKMSNNIATAHRNFLRDAVYFLYGANRIADAAKWYRYLGEHYPNKTLIDGDTNSFPRNVSLDEFAVAMVQGDVNDLGHDKIRASINFLLINAYREEVLGDDDRAAGYLGLAKKVWANYQSKISDTGKRHDTLTMPPFDEIKREVVKSLLDPERGMPPDMRAALRQKLNMPPEAKVEKPPTNAPSMTLEE